MHPAQSSEIKGPPWVELLVASDKMGASLHFVNRPSPPPQPVPAPKSPNDKSAPLSAEESKIEIPTPEQLRAQIDVLLKAQKVSFGINEEEIGKAIQLWIRDGLPRTHLIAKGQAAADGKDAIVEILFKPSESGKIGQTGLVDYRNRGYLCNVPAGTRLMQVTKMREAVPGKTVTGEDLPAKPGKDVKIEVSPLIRAVEAQDTITYEAEADAVLEELSASRIRLTRALEIKRDIDHHTGSIDVFGSVTVKGWVTPHLSVHATENVTVQEGIESAFVEAKGSLNTPGGIIGKVDLTEIKTGGDLTCRFSENAKLEVGGDAHIQDFVVSSHIYCNGNIHLTERHGLVLTSRLIAGGSIIANTLGSTGEGHVEVTAGNNPQAWRQVTRLQQELFFMKRQSYKIGGKKPFRNSEHHQKSLELRRAKKNRMGFILERIIERRKRRIISDLGSRDALPVIQVNQKVFPNTKVMMGPFSVRVREEMKAGTFKLDLHTASIIWEPKYK